MLPLFELDNPFHHALCVFYYGSLDFDDVLRKDGISSQSIVTRAELVDFRELKTVMGGISAVIGKVQAVMSDSDSKTTSCSV